MKRYTLLFLRLLLGIPLLFFGFMGLFKVMPDPATYWQDPVGFDPYAAKLMLMMWETKFIMISVGVTHLVTGTLLLVNRFVPLALLIHIPVSLQMSLFHLTLDPSTGVVAFLISALNFVLIYMYRDSYKSLFAAKTEFVSDFED